MDFAASSRNATPFLQLGGALRDELKRLGVLCGSRYSWLANSVVILIVWTKLNKKKKAIKSYNLLHFSRQSLSKIYLEFWDLNYFKLNYLRQSLSALEIRMFLVLIDKNVTLTSNLDYI